MSNRRGRPVVDVEWNAILSRAVEALPHEDEDNHSLVEQWRLTGELPHGCKLRPGQAMKAEERVWLCSMYLGQKQRVIGTGSLHQCARLYDAALFRFKKFRLHPDNDRYNFSEKQAQVDNTLEADVVSYLTALENLLIARGQLVSSQDRRDVRDIHITEERHSRTATGRIENTQRIMIQQIEGLKVAVQTITDLLRQTALTLSVLNSRLTFTPSAVDDKKVVPMIPQLACFNPTSMAPVGVKK